LEKTEHSSARVLSSAVASEVEIPFARGVGTGIMIGWTKRKGIQMKGGKDKLKEVAHVAVVIYEKKILNSAMKSLGAVVIWHPEFVQA
jgi:hypothetical protein